MKRTILLSLLILLIVVCLCFCGLALAAGGYLAFNPPTFAGPSSGQGDEDNLAEPTLAITPLPTSTSSPVLPDEVARQMDEIERQVIALRRLQPKAPVNRHMLTREELQQKVTEEFFVDYTAEEARQDVLILSLLGLLEPDYDIYRLYIDLYSEQVAGYYDDQTKEMYVVQGEGFTGVERMTYAHEYVHALQDQTYDLENGLKLNDEYCETNTEYCAAVTALIEGDATFSEQTWYFRHATEEDQQQVQDFYSAYTSPIFNSAPEYLKQDFLFPYQQGLEFVQSLYDRGGWAAIEQAYRELPQSTEQILHPDQYPYDTPEAVQLPDFRSTLGGEWQQIDDNVMGEWYTFLILAYGREDRFRLPLSTARQAASGWKGDAYTVYQKTGTDEAVLIFRSRWETEQDITEFWEALTAYGEKRWGNPDERERFSLRWDDTEDGAVSIFRLEDDVVWVGAPNADMLDSIMEILRSGS